MVLVKIMCLRHIGYLVLWVNTDADAEPCLLMDHMNDVADNLFEEVEPVAVLKARKNENGTRDFLVKWSDGSEDSWVRALHPSVSGSAWQALTLMHPVLPGLPPDLQKVASYLLHEICLWNGTSL